MGDALYASSYEPWSEWLTGTQGTTPSPSWDPLQYAIDVGRTAGIEVHAWLNPYRANVRGNTAALSPGSMCNTISQHCHAYGSYMWMDPGAQEVQDQLYNVVMDIATRYDVTGIHFDDYFYPYPVSGVDFPDDLTWNSYANGGGSMSRADWRRDNVNKIVQRLYNGIRGLDSTGKRVRFSIGPFGIYRPGHPDGMPPPIQGFDQYTQLYADPRLWLNQGWVDIMQPQLYWQVNAPNQPYRPLLEWWCSENTAGRHVYAGLYLSRVDPNNGDWPLSEIQSQVHISREYTSSGSWGNLMYSYAMYRRNIKNIVSVFQSDPYNETAVQPSMPWLSPRLALSEPTNVHTEGSLLVWNEDMTGAVKNWAVFLHTPLDLKLVKVVPNNTPWLEVGAGAYFIRALDVANVMGPVSDMVTMG
eukprot:GHVU01125680.1.p1 GENE.GHVU01125680.1~~GHVU01125680.1.p1  ORF type:complete len:485 (-),score=16.56 GHVU01125680.1:43-1284(-)